MKREQKIAFDMSSWMWTNLSGGYDSENGYEVEHGGKMVKINSADYGYDKCVTRMYELLQETGLKPIDMILVFEGKSSKSKRLAIDPAYKGGGDSRPDEAYQEFHRLKGMLSQLWLDLGAIALTQDLAEGDDVLGYLAVNTEVDLLIATFDNDLSVLNMEQNPFGAKVEVWVNGLLGMNKYGLFDHHLITTYKALVGDSSDNIKGCPGFGPKAFEAFAQQYGLDGVQQLQDALMARGFDRETQKELDAMCQDKEHKALAKIMENLPQVQRCFDLARIHPEWVNTMAHPLQWQVGRVRQVEKTDDHRLKPWYGRARLITMAEFEAARQFVREKLATTREVALDIETSTPDESDAWLEAQKTKSQRGEGVDVFGSTLTGLGLTFGDNNQYTFYFSVDHADTDNIPSELVRQVIAEIPQEVPIVIQNTAFELVVLFNEWADKQADNGYHGFLPNVRDTVFEGSYVNENMALGLKERSQFYLNYRQQTYDETVNLTGKPDELPKGGRLLSENYLMHTVETGKMVPSAEDPDVMVPETKVVPVMVESGEYEMEDDGVTMKLKKKQPIPIMVPVVDTVTRRYKMNELSAKHVVGYGADDPICTIALHNFYKLHMQLEHHWKVYLQVELDAAYQHAKNFIDGVPISLEEMNRQMKEDDANFDKAWAVLRTYLMKKGWTGTTCPEYGTDISVAQVKEAFQIVTGEELGTMMRTMSKLVTFIREVKEQPILATLLERITAPVEDAQIMASYVKSFNDYIKSKFSGEPEFNDGSPIQMCRLLYEVMGLPIRVRNKPTEIMRSNGITEGNPKADALAIEYGLRDAAGDEEKLAVLNALKIMSMVGTRRTLFYNQYPYFPHWKDGKVRSSHRQCSTNTRRASSAKPNLQQLPKHPKMEGFEAAFRRVIVPHKPGAVVVSIDFDSQELRIIAEQSQDPVALSMFVGDNLRGPHSLTGLGIVQRTDEDKDFTWTYEVFEAVREDKSHPKFKLAKEARRLGKKLNFVAEYGAAAPKVAATLMITEDEAQMYLDAREDMFPIVKEWKEETIAEAKKKGVVRTMLGAVRHLRDALMSDDRFEASKAERQAVNFKVQGSSAEQTKEAEGRMWRRGLFFRYDAVCYGPIHDEIVSSVMIEDLVPFLQEAHACMAVQYAGMKVPCVGSISFGKNFFDQIEIGTEPTVEAIEKGLCELRGEKEPFLHDDTAALAA